MKSHLYFIKNETEMIRCGSILACNLNPPKVLFINGEIGAGKTTLTRGILRGLGFYGYVKSPTYSIVETYLISELQVEHFDLYRITDSEELIWIGIENYFQKNAITIVEWPEQGGKFLPQPNIIIDIKYQGRGRTIELS